MKFWKSAVALSPSNPQMARPMALDGSADRLMCDPSRLVEFVLASAMATMNMDEGGKLQYITRSS